MAKSEHSELPAVCHLPEWEAEFVKSWPIKTFATWYALWWHMCDCCLFLQRSRNDNKGGFLSGGADQCSLGDTAQVPGPHACWYRGLRDGLFCHGHREAHLGGGGGQGGHQEDRQALPVTDTRQEDLQRTQNVKTHEAWKCKWILLVNQNLNRVFLLDYRAVRLFHSSKKYWQVFRSVSKNHFIWICSKRLLLLFRYLVTPLMDLDLNNIIKIQKLTDDQVKFIVYQIMRGLKYIHSAGIIHR